MVVRVERLFPKQNEHPGRRIYVEATNLTDATRSERYTLVTTVLTDAAYPDGIEASYVTWAAEAKPEQGKPKVGHRGYTVAPKPGSAHPAATKVGGVKPQAGDSQGSDPKPFRLIQRVSAPGAEPTLTPVGRYESMAAAMHAADELVLGNGGTLGWKHREAPPGYPAYTARFGHDDTAVISFVAWDTREQGKAEAAAKAK